MLVAVAPNVSAATKKHTKAAKHGRVTKHHHRRRHAARRRKHRVTKHRAVVPHTTQSTFSLTLNTEPASTTTGTTTGTPPPSPPTTTSTSPMFGVTIDGVSGMSTVMSAEAAMPYKATTRVVLDNAAASQFTSAISQLHGHSPVMAEILDSATMAGVSNTQVDSATKSYTSAFGSNVDIWEVGNELNGNWTGSYSTVGQKMQTMYNDVKAVNPNATTALTLYYNNPSGGPASNCGDGTSELTPEQYTQQYVPPAIANGLDYVLLSYYPTQCGNYEPTSAQVAKDVEALHALYPNAKIGFGELGTPNAATSSSATQANQIMQWGYSLNPGESYYIGGYFWWYGAQDVFGQSGCGCMTSDLNTAFNAEHAAIG